MSKTGKFVLGKKLADLEQTTAGQSPEIAALSGMADRVVARAIPVAQIGANPDQPRKNFTPDELKELAESITEHGVLQPIIVRAVQDRPYMYEIIAGERRWRASKIAGLETIPAIVKTVTPETSMELALIENVQRENLNAIEECEAYRNIMDKCRYGIADVSRLIGKSESYIRNALRLSDLPDKVKELVKSKKISASHARTLTVSGNAEALADEVVKKNLSVGETAKLVKAAPRASTAKRKASKGDAARQEVLRGYEKELEKRLNVHVKIDGRRGGAARISLLAESAAETERLVALLSRL